MSDFTERVLEFIERIPPGKVVTYGLIADALGDGGARHVGRVMSLRVRPSRGGASSAPTARSRPT